MQRYVRKLLWLALPCLALYLWLMVYPTIYAFRFSLYEWAGFGDRLYIGFQNYLLLFQDAVFQLVLRNTLVLVGIGIVTFTIGGFVLALLVNSRFPGVELCKTIYFLPVIISATAVGLLWRLIYHPDIGLLNNFLRAIGLERYALIWLSETKLVLYLAFLPSIWQSVGFYMILFYTGIVSIPRTCLEAAVIDGATLLQQLRLIILPLLRETIFVCLVLISTSILISFDQIYVLTKGGPLHRSEVLAIYMYTQTLVLYQAGRAMAVAVITFLIAVSFIVLFRRLIRPAETGYS